MRVAHTKVDLCWAVCCWLVVGGGRWAAFVRRRGTSENRLCKYVFCWPSLSDLLAALLWSVDAALLLMTLQNAGRCLPSPHGDDDDDDDDGGDSDALGQLTVI